MVDLQEATSASSASSASQAVDPSYGAIDNSASKDTSTIYDILNVQPPTAGPLLLRRLTWRTHARLLPLLLFRDAARAKDFNVNLCVLWNKAIASLDSRSPAFEQERWTFDMLPWSRWILRTVPIGLFPRWLHANIELRTAYLDQAIDREIERIPAGINVRLVCLGGGYDTRSLRLLSKGSVQEAWDLDLPQVVDSKRLMLERLCHRRKKQVFLPQLWPVDLNDLDAVQSAFETIVGGDKPRQWHTIFVSEAVLMYLDEGVPIKLLKMCGGSIQKSKGSASLCFAERLENVPQDAKMGSGRRFLDQARWTMVDWLLKPGRACHLGVARR